MNEDLWETNKVEEKKKVFSTFIMVLSRGLILLFKQKNFVLIVKAH